MPNLPPAAAFQKAKAAALKAIEIDPQSAEAYASLAYVDVYYEWDFPKAEKEFRRSLDINPNYATAHEWYSIFLSALGRLDDAEIQIHEAQALDPLSLSIATDIGFEMFLARKRIPSSIAQPGSNASR